MSNLLFVKDNVILRANGIRNLENSRPYYPDGKIRLSNNVIDILKFYLQLKIIWMKINFLIEVYDCKNYIEIFWLRLTYSLPIKIWPRSTRRNFRAGSTWEFKERRNCHFYYINIDWWYKFYLNAMKFQKGSVLFDI